MRALVARGAPMRWKWRVMRSAMPSFGDTSSHAPPVRAASERTKASATAAPTPTVNTRWPEATARSTTGFQSLTSPSVTSSTSSGSSPPVRDW